MVQWAVLSLCMAMLWVGTYALSLYALYSLPSVSLSLLFSVLYPISYGVSLYGVVSMAMGTLYGVVYGV